MDLDGHRKFAVDDSGTSRLGYEPPSKPKTSSGGKKVNDTSSGSYSEGGSNGGSSHNSASPTPNHTEKYQKQSFFDKLKAKASSAVDSVKSFLLEPNKTIKSIESSISNSKVVKKVTSVLNEVTTYKPKSEQEIKANMYKIRLLTVLMVL